MNKQINQPNELINTLCEKQITIEAPAKINLTLDVTGLLPNGYHTVSTVLHPITLADRVTVGFTKDDEDLQIFCDRPNIPLDQSNLCAIAAEKFFEYLGKPRPGMVIYIEKKIPEQAGLGGGSADAAATLRALNLLTKAGLSSLQLEEIGASFGADIPACVRNRCVLATGFGEKLKNLQNMPACHIVVVKPKEGSSTVAAFAEIDRSLKKITHPSGERMVEALDTGSLEKVANAIGNVFEEALHLPSTNQIKEKLVRLGAIGAMLCGSGTAVFGLFKDKARAIEAQEKFLNEKMEAFVCEPFYL